MVEHIERQTKQKDAIRAALADCEEFISAQDLHRRLEDEGSKIGLATVYRQLNALADAGAADTIRLDGQQLFRLRNRFHLGRVDESRSILAIGTHFHVIVR